jgi:FolB domain-containing protein
VDHIFIEGLEVDCIVGVRPLERRRKQLVRLDLSLFIDLSVAGKTGRISDTLDYARIADEVGGLLRFREYQLIEVATEELAAMLFGVHAQLQALQIRLEKPEALRGRARSASVQIHRERSQFPVAVSDHDWGEHQLLLMTHEARLELFRMKPQVTSRLGAACRGRRIEWKVLGQLSRDGRQLDREPEERAPGQPCSYSNLGADVAALFRCECVPIFEQNSRNIA